MTAARQAAARDDGGRQGWRKWPRTARMDPPQWAADRGRRRRIHDGQGLLLPSRERIDDGRRQMAPDGEKNWVSAAAAVTQTCKGKWVWGSRVAAPKSKTKLPGAAQRRREGWRPDLNLELCYHVTIEREEEN